MIKLIPLLLIILFCCSCVIQKEVVIRVDDKSTAHVSVQIKGSDLEDVSASAEAALVP